MPFRGERSRILFCSGVERRAEQQSNEKGKWPGNRRWRNWSQKESVVKAGSVRSPSADASALAKLNSWRLLKLIKIKSARSRLYRSQILQVNTRWNALAEIYTMHSFAPCSYLIFFVENYWNFWLVFITEICKILSESEILSECCQNVLRILSECCQNFAQFLFEQIWPNVDHFFRDFHKMQHFSEHCWKKGTVSVPKFKLKNDDVR